MPRRRRRHVMTHYELINSLKATPIAEGIYLTFKPARKALFVPSQWTPRLVGPSFKCRTEPFWIVDNKKVSYQNPCRKYSRGLRLFGYKHFPRCHELDDVDSCSETQLESSDDEQSGLPRWPVQPPWPVSLQDAPLLYSARPPFKFKLRPSSGIIDLE